MRASMRRLLTQDLRIIPLVSLNAYGEAAPPDLTVEFITPSMSTSNAPYTIKARIEYSFKKIVSAQGNEVFSTAHAFITGDNTVQIIDKVQLPGSDKQLNIQRIDFVIDRDSEGSIHHKVVYV